MTVRTIRTVLVANRGEIAVRILRACADTGLRSVAVYADGDRDAPFVQLADEAHALDGSTAAQTYLAQRKVLDAAARSGADAVHPGYGFLAENADFAQAVLDAGLTWVGPSPQAIRALGDKTTARHIAASVGAPLVPGSKGPVASADEVTAFATEHGLPVAIKAAFGGGGRGLRVARTVAEIPECYDAAVREADAAFGRGECFVERYLDRARHVEAQILADTHGTVIVAGTRDCSLQRRHQKLVEEAPAPFLTDAQRRQIHDAARAICTKAGYHGAGTVEFLVAEDGTVAFLEVNTRLQVEHPVTEETTGLDLVVEQFRIAAGERLRITADPAPRGHAIEFRINGEDAAHGFVPAPGTLTLWVEPSGPGIRVDSGVEPGSVVGGQFDSLLAKLVVTGATREQALDRARHALAEFRVDGLPTVLPFHRAVVDDPAFTAVDGFAVHTRWIETDFAADRLDAPTPDPLVVTIEIGGRPHAVALPGLSAVAAATAAAIRERAGERQTGGTTAVRGDEVLAPMQGTVAKIAVSDGDTVDTGDLIAVVEAMKMENPVLAHQAGTICGLDVRAGASVGQGTALCTVRADGDIGACAPPAPPHPAARS